MGHKNPAVTVAADYPPTAGANTFESMPKIAANLYTMFTEVPFLDRFEAAAQAGFAGVEMFLTSDAPAAEVRARLVHHGLELVHCFFDVGDFAAEERGIAIFPARRDEFRATVERGIEYATATGCKRVSCLAGILTPRVERGEAEETLSANVAEAGAACAEAGLVLLVEPISNQGPDYFIRRTAEARALVESVALPNVRMLYDVYHAQVLEGNLAETIRENLAVIAHIHVADVPGRHEPGTGEINFAFLLDWMDAHAYAGWVGCEYRPSGMTAQTLAWAAPYLNRE
jgi:hydroxypyruvate isomerase